MASRDKGREVTFVLPDSTVVIRFMGHDTWKGQRRLERTFPNEDAAVMYAMHLLSCMPRAD